MKLTAGLVVVGIAMVWANSAMAADYTWTGSGSGLWSEGSDWIGGTAPSPGSSIGTLTFGKRVAAINLSENDVSGLAVNRWQIEDNHEYLISGDPLTLGEGGLLIDGSEPEGAPPTGTPHTEITIPLTLTASQAWTIEGAQGQSISIPEALSGSGADLTIDFTGGGPSPWMLLGQWSHFNPVQVEDELGNVTIEGRNSPVVELGAALNVVDEHPLTLKGVIFHAAGGATGPLISEGSTVVVAPGTIEQEGFGPERFQVGQARFDARSKVAFAIKGAGTTPGLDYSQLTSRGPINLGGAGLELYGPCPAVVPGQVYTLVSTDSSLSGSFANAPNGGVIGCGSISYRIAYNTTSSPQTVTLTALGTNEGEKESGGGGLPSAGGNTMSPSQPTSVPMPVSTLPPQTSHTQKPKSLHCRKGFKKQKLHGKQQCVKVKGKRRRQARNRARLALSLVSGFTKKPVVGGPPRLGTYKLSGAGASLVVRRSGSHYEVTHIRLRLLRPGGAIDNECGAYRNQLVTIPGSFTLRRHVAHRISETEVSYEIPRVKGFRASGQGNPTVLNGGQRVSGNLDLGFGPFPPPWPPLLGDIDLGQVEGLNCDVTFRGHPVRH